MNQDIWEKAFLSDNNLEIINQIKAQLLEYRTQTKTLVEDSAECLSTVDQCVPNIAPFVKDIVRLQPRDIDAGGLPPDPLMQKLSMAKSIYRRRICTSGTGTLWVRRKWTELQSVQISDELKSIFRTENILLLLLGPVDVRQIDVLESCYEKLPEILTLLADIGSK